MIYLKHVPCLFCNGCSFMQYMDNAERRDKPAFEVTDNSIAYVGNPTNSPRKDGSEIMATLEGTAGLTKKAG